MACCAVPTFTTLPDLDQLDREALKELLRVTRECLLSPESEIEHLKLLLAKLHRMQFGRKSEKLQRQIEQLELRLEELQAKDAESVLPTENTSSLTIPATALTPMQPTRRPLPEHLPRKTQMHEVK